jgi:uncharacterized protein
MWMAQSPKVHYFDMEDPASLAILDEPMTVFQPLRGLIVIDEIQRRPDLFPILRVLADRLPLSAKFLILGSASPELLRQASESLAGRIEYVELTGFTLAETGRKGLGALWLSGGLPPSYTAATPDDSFEWRRQFIRTFLERDLPAFGLRIPSATLHRFWTMLAHYHGRIWNAAELGRSMGVNETTARRYLDLMESLFMVRCLQPWRANIRKRQVKSPKILFRDTGILHALLGIRAEMDLLSHPVCGPSWEGLAIEEALNVLRPDGAYFWATHNGAEMDLVIQHRSRLYGIECKRADAPRLTPSIRAALADLELDHVWVIYPGDRRYALADKVDVLPLAELAGAKSPFGM